MTTSLTGRKVAKKEIEARVIDWKRRLKELMAQIEAWSTKLPFEIEVCRGEIEVQEELMKQMKHPPARLPTITLLRKKGRLAFVPSALWITGANGRVNVVGHKSQCVLVDMGDYDRKKSDWRIVSKDLNRKSMRFDRAYFKNLIADELA